MNTTAIVLVVAAILVAAAALLHANDLRRRRRRKRRRDFALQHGFETLPDDDPVKAGFAFPREIALYDHALSRVESPLRASRGGVDLLLFDYSFTEPVGDRGFRRNFTVCHFRCSKLDLPAFELRVASIGDKLATVLGARDVELPETPAFSKKFVLRGTDEAAVRRVFTPSVTSVLEPASNIAIYGLADLLVVTRGGGYVAEPELPALVREAERILESFRR